MDTASYIGPDDAPDRYRLRRSIGRGGEAVLYLAELELGGATEPVVVKMLDDRQALSRELFARVSAKWREQAELLRFVHRPGVVGIREHFEGPSAHPAGTLPEAAGRALYLVMNHVQGLDLRDWRAERTLESADERRAAVRCLEQLAEVLDWLHSGAATPSGRRVVHGDLSPGNVMIDEHGQATLVDFGLSKLAADHRTAEVWFTPGFAAPEVFDGIRSPATDRYAFGAIAYFLLSGESPATVPETLRAALLALPALAGLSPEKAARVAAIFAADPESRPTSLTSWVREMRSLVVSATRPEQPPVPAAAPVPPLPPPGPPVPPALPPQPVHAPQPVFRSPVPVLPPTVPEPPARRQGLRITVAAVVAAALVGGGAVLGVVLSGGDKGDDAGKRPPTTPAATGGSTGGTTSQQPAAGDGTATGTPTGAPTDAGGGGSGTGDSGGDTSDPSAADEVSLADLTPTDESIFSLERKAAAVDGVQYQDSLTSSYCYRDASGLDGFGEYNLGKKYATLDVVLGLDDNSPNTGDTFTVIADGKRIFRDRATVGKPFHKKFDVSGVLRLRVEWVSDDELNCPTTVLGDPTLIP
ncbi:protein kinase domain-containing protein [Streptomyces sp. NRRL F-5123]|uniref:protein kinase domain-containing protein n=1 Tax=Streptomyces sp. NRRL F-5123 TaxID=1463856 RepID=UPI0004E1682F|nr:protein kinase [Streptomyces sp. NRRL F-5123]